MHWEISICVTLLSERRVAPSISALPGQINHSLYSVTSVISSSWHHPDKLPPFNQRHEDAMRADTPSEPTSEQAGDQIQENTRRTGTFGAVAASISRILQLSPI
jgi:hypothetical protein